MQLKVENLNFIYSPGTAFEHAALKDINFSVNAGEIIGIIGSTGSGKSTLVQHLNGLIKATSGNIYFHDESIYADRYDKKNLRKKVGLVFQYPEYQLFENDVITDVKFGPKNAGMSDKDAEASAKNALTRVGIEPDVWTKSPFEISGGQKRRVAIAGVLAMNPEVLVLDEPTAGLDPAGRDEILGHIRKLHDETGCTVILVSHSMEDIASYVDRVLVMSHGSILYDGTPQEVFSHYEELEKIGLAAPQVTYVVSELRKKGFNIEEGVTTIAEAKKAIMKALGK